MDPPPNSDLYGEPKYVTVLPDYIDVTMDYRFFHWGMIIFIILIVLTLIILAIIGVSVARDNAVIKEPKGSSPSSPANLTIDFTLIEQVFGLHDDPGATSNAGVYRHIHNGEGLKSPETCTSVPYRQWNSDLNRCDCVAPFWGKYCERESYSRSVKAFGHIDPSLEQGLTYLDELTVHRQSFNFDGADFEQSTCDQACLDNVDCIGYVLDRTSPSFGTDTSDPTIICKLLGEVPDIKGISFDPAIDSNLFFFRDRVQRPRLPHHVFLYNGELRSRFWLEQRITSKTHNLVNIGLERLNHIHFYPEAIINDDDAYVVFSFKHFTVSEAIAIIALYQQDGKVPFGWHVYAPGKNIMNPPHSWTTDGENFWAMAISKETIRVQQQTSPIFKSREKLNYIIEELKDRTNPVGIEIYKGYDQTESGYDSLNPPEVTGEYTGFEEHSLSSTSNSGWESC